MIPYIDNQDNNLKYNLTDVEVITFSTVEQRNFIKSCTKENIMISPFFEISLICMCKDIEGAITWAMGMAEGATFQA